MAKKGECVNCGREDTQLIAKGLCWTCYAAQKDLEGGCREIALAEARTKYKGKASRGPGIKGPGVVESDGSGGALKPYPAAEESHDEKGQQKDADRDTIILVRFEDSDAKLHDKIMAAATRNRREPMQEILSILEKAING